MTDRTKQYAPRSLIYICIYMYYENFFSKCKYSKEGQRGSSFTASLRCTKTAISTQSCSTAYEALWWGIAKSDDPLLPWFFLEGGLKTWFFFYGILLLEFFVIIQTDINATFINSAIFHDIVLKDKLCQPCPKTNLIVCLLILFRPSILFKLRKPPPSLKMQFK